MFSTPFLGLVFLVVGLAAMFLMYHLWSYPFDKDNRLSSAPRWAMWTHRGLGYLFGVIYIVLMWRMVPRLWEYQVEFPARTTAHIILGFTIGFLLVIKISIARFFRHFEEWMPYLGTAIMLGTVLLLALSLPSIMQERALHAGAPGGDALSAASRARVAQLLPQAGLPSDARLSDLSTEKALASGRDVLVDSCAKCHDLKTILSKPRTPHGWWSTVERMAEKPALFAPMTDREMFEVTAYLIAITPELQRASKRRYAEDQERADAMDSASELDDTGAPAGSGAGSGAAGSGSGSGMRTGSGSEPGTRSGSGMGSGPGSGIGMGSGMRMGSGSGSGMGTASGSGTGTGAGPGSGSKPVAAPVDLAKAKSAYQRVCSQCHELSDVDKAPPKTRGQTRALILRMIKDNDAEITSGEIRLITAWLNAHFVDAGNP